MNGESMNDDAMNEEQMFSYLNFDPIYLPEGSIIVDPENKFIELVNNPITENILNRILNFEESEELA